MINLAELGRVFIVYGKTDMRRGIDSLAYIVKKSFNLAPFSGCVFLFCGSRRDRFKALYWDGQGFWLLYKRFENGSGDGRGIGSGALPAGHRRKQLSQLPQRLFPEDGQDPTGGDRHSGAQRPEGQLRAENHWKV